MVAIGRGGDSPIVPLLLCLMGALSWGIGNVVSRPSGASSGLSLTVWSALVVPVPMLALSMLFDGPAEIGDAMSNIPWQAVASSLYTVVLASLVGYTIFNSLLAQYESASVVPWVLLAPAVAIASAWLLLDDQPSTGELVGGALLVAGVLVALRPSRSAPSPSPSHVAGSVRLNGPSHHSGPPAQHSASAVETAADAGDHGCEQELVQPRSFRAARQQRAHRSH